MTTYSIEWIGKKDRPYTDKRYFDSEEKADAFILELKSLDTVEHIWKTKTEKIK